MDSKAQPTGLLLKGLKAVGCTSPAIARQELLTSLDRCAQGRCTDLPSLVDQAIQKLATVGHLVWAVSATYWSLLRKENKLPPGLVFTPPALADQVVDRLRWGLPVVDLGAGTGMLSLAAAARGFMVTAIEQDPELVFILNALTKIIGLQDRVEVVLGDAFSYRGQPGSQIMANPPYTRHHLLPAEAKRAMSKLVRELGTPLFLTAGHYAYFMVHAWHTTWSDREVLLVPTNWLETRYGEPLRQLLRNRGTFEIAIADHRSDASVFRHALATTCIVTTQRQSTGASTKVDSGTFRSLKVSASGTLVTTEPGTELAEIWRRRIGTSRVSPEARPFLLGEVFDVRRGVATGANSFFVLSEQEARMLGIPEEELVATIRTLSPGPGREPKGFLWTPKDQPSPASRARIKEGERLRINERHLCQRRDPWWRIGTPDPPQYLLSYMGRSEPRVQKNTEGLTNLNSIHGLYLVEGVLCVLAERIVKWLATESGRAALLGEARHYQGGLWKLEPRDVEQVEIPGFLLGDATAGEAKVGQLVRFGTVDS